MIEYKIIEHLGRIGLKKWPMEVNVIAWNNAEPKLDIRAWQPEEEAQGKRKCGKGITLTDEEARVLQEILADYVYK